MYSGRTIRYTISQRLDINCDSIFIPESVIKIRRYKKKLGINPAFGIFGTLYISIYRIFSIFSVYRFKKKMGGKEPCRWLFTPYSSTPTGYLTDRVKVHLSDILYAITMNVTTASSNRHSRVKELKNNLSELYSTRNHFRSGNQFWLTYYYLPTKYVPVTYGFDKNDFPTNYKQCLRHIWILESPQRFILSAEKCTNRQR